MAGFDLKEGRYEVTTLHKRTMADRQVIIRVSTS